MAVSQDDVYGTSAWKVGHAQDTARFANVLRKYGIVPDASTLATYGLGSLFDQGQADNANANPDSIFAGLGRSRDQGFAQNFNTANAHGALFSGARVNSADQVGRDYQRNVGTAGQDELDQLLGIGGDEATLYNTVYGQLLSQPVAADTTVYPPGIVSTGSGTAFDPTIVTNPNVDNPTTPSGTSTGGWHQSDTAGNALVPVKPPKPKPIVGGRGHVT